MRSARARGAASSDPIRAPDSDGSIERRCDPMGRYAACRSTPIKAAERTACSGIDGYLTENRRRDSCIEQAIASRYDADTVKLGRHH